MATARREHLSISAALFLCLFSTTSIAEESIHWELPALSQEERHHLTCFMKNLLFDENGDGKLCCLPDEARNATCAIVGNSGSLLDYELGEEIDSHPVVLRMNDAPIKGFEKHVGSKLGFRMGWNATESHFLGQEEADEIYALCQGPDEERFKKNHPRALVSPIRCAAGVLKDMLSYLYPGNLNSASGLEGEASTGARAVMLALSSCKRVVLYGMTPSHSGSTPFQYYGMHAKTQAHSFASKSMWKAEHDLWMRLSESTVKSIMRAGSASLTGLRDEQGCDEDFDHPGFASSWLNHMKRKDQESFLVVDSAGTASHRHRTSPIKKRKHKKNKKAVHQHDKDGTAAKGAVPWPPPPISNKFKAVYDNLRKELLAHHLMRREKPTGDTLKPDQEG